VGNVSRALSLAGNALLFVAIICLGLVIEYDDNCVRGNQQAPWCGFLDASFALVTP
jgi:hypothetical protein